ncbi:hypothetical protein [Arenimonas composti]|nr:hypothetical protein [Arenimonas composti]
MNAMVRWLLVLALLLPGVAAATAQEGDRIRLDGKEFWLQTEPLEEWIKAQGWRPPEAAMISSSNWRGYIAEWTVEEGQLVLVDAWIRVRGRSEEFSMQQQSIREDLFPAMPRVVADWYSGAILIPDGELVDYVHLGYGSTFDHYQLLIVEHGRVVEYLSLDRAAFEAYREERFAAFSRSAAFAEVWTRFGDQDWTDEEKLDFIRAFYAEQYLSYREENP